MLNRPKKHEIKEQGMTQQETLRSKNHKDTQIKTCQNDTVK